MITLPTPIVRTHTTTGFVLGAITDDSKAKKVSIAGVYFDDNPNQIRPLIVRTPRGTTDLGILWKDTPANERLNTPADLAYTNIGQWTQEQAEARVLELVTAYLSALTS